MGAWRHGGIEHAGFGHAGGETRGGMGETGWGHTTGETGWGRTTGETAWNHGTAETHRNQIISVDPKETRLHGAEEPRIFTEGREGYREPAETPTGPMERFRDPHALVDGINPRFGLESAYETNCADCARAFEAAWRGYGVEAAGRLLVPEATSDPEHPVTLASGERLDVTEQWAHESYAPTDARTLYRRLDEAGPGASAIVSSHWADAEGHISGHAYNVVNHEGRILVADAQTHEVFVYSPDAIAPWLEGEDVVAQYAMAWDAAGGRIDTTRTIIG
ncbi:hypothetical protein JS531_02055 [Bifidobacterium sp. CP2]|uniref:toxin glutamine deamidase domain-containing protein n=1 Tax=Bifidobacterium sp. CP2 TaxID=2809025 RepID=UPI001BDD9AA7|nr:toxin glutamine deamidase domain-containing protein [Bifidobacterium sp. CP2]MBT1180774.1 hypothetical protein [Bifidobacterium sp. CP2]